MNTDTAVGPVHPWIGTAWVNAFSIDSWDLAVQKRWPGAVSQVVARGAVWRRDGRIVAELRNSRRAWPPREAWVADLPPS